MMWRFPFRLDRAAFLALALTLVANGAWAEGAEERANDAEAMSPQAASPDSSSSYTTAMLIAHAAPLGAMWAVAIVADAKNDGEYLTPFGLTLAPVILTPPVVHAWHGNWGRSAGSFGINLAAALPGWATMWFGVLQPCTAVDEFRERCDYRIFKKTAAVHTLFGGLATLADIAMSDVEPDSSRGRAQPATIQAGVSPIPGGLMLGAQGIF